MLFNSAKFIIFFPIAVLLYFLLPRKIKNLWLLLAGYFFYMCWNPRYIVLLLGSTVITYAGALILDKINNSERKEEAKHFLKKIALWGTISANLLILAYFKYFNFIIDFLRSAFKTIHVDLNIPHFDILLPVGISFYIFQALGYLADVSRNEIKAEKNFLKYALFVSFFPQLVAGPIERAKNLLKQLEITRRFDVNNARNGLLIMLWGYFLKLVIADRCAIVVNNVYSDFSIYSGSQIVFAVLLFTIQIYCDFMGYSKIAKGSALVLGIRLTENFNQPFFAASIREHWRRWHISLSLWLRDYIYIPLGGSRCSVLKKYRNIFTTFLLGGLWHGASYNFVLWGCLHGIYIILEDMFKRLSAKLKMPEIPVKGFIRLLLVVKTFLLIAFTFIFFRAQNITEAFQIFAALFDFKHFGDFSIYNLTASGLDIFELSILAAAIIVLFVTDYMNEFSTGALKRLSECSPAFRYIIYWCACLMIIFSLNINGKEFIYFRF